MTSKHISVFEELKQVDALVDLQREPQKVVERLPFTVRLVQNEEDLMKAVQVRYEAYAKHLPSSAAGLRDPEIEDERPDTAVLLAESKLDGSALGSVRVQTNRDGPLPIEKSIQLPVQLRSMFLADARRLSIVRGGEGGLVRTAIFKALFLYWEHIEIDWGIVAARSPLHRTYERLMFHNLLADSTLYPMTRMAGQPQFVTALGVPHYVMGVDMHTAHQRWIDSKHPLLNFFRHTEHPDIRIDDSRHAKGATFPSLYDDMNHMNPKQTQQLMIHN